MNLYISAIFALVLLTQMTKCYGFFQFVLPNLYQGMAHTLSKYNADSNISNLSENRNIKKQASIPMSQRFSTNDDTFSEFQNYMRLRKNFYNIIGKRNQDPAVNANIRIKTRGRVNKARCRLFDLGKFYALKPKDIEC